MCVCVCVITVWKERVEMDDCISLLTVRSTEEENIWILGETLPADGSGLVLTV